MNFLGNEEVLKAFCSFHRGKSFLRNYKSAFENFNCPNLPFHAITGNKSWNHCSTPEWEEKPNSSFNFFKLGRFRVSLFKWSFTRQTFPFPVSLIRIWAFFMFRDFATFPTQLEKIALLIFLAAFPYGKFIFFFQNKLKFIYILKEREREKSLFANTKRKRQNFLLLCSKGSDGGKLISFLLATRRRENLIKFSFVLSSIHSIRPPFFLSPPTHFSINFILDKDHIFWRRKVFKKKYWKAI